MKIALVYDPIYPYVIGGGEKRFWELACRLVKNNHDVYLVGMKYWSGDSKIIKEGVNIIGVCPAVPLYNKKGIRLFWEPFYFGFFVFFHLLRNSYDIVDCGNFPYISCIAAKFATFFKGTKLIITWHEVWGKKQWINYAGKIGICGWWIEKLVSKLTTRNIFVSEFTRERALNLLKVKLENTVVIPNGVEFDKLQKVCSDDKGNQIIYVGRLIEHKRVDVLIDVFSIVVKKFPEVILKIVGDGPEKDNLELRVERLGMKENVVFAGFIESEVALKEIKKSKIFVLPSEREGMGIVIVESMALGTPVIALNSEHSAAKSIIKNNEDGILVKNKMEMAEAIIVLLMDRGLYNKLIVNGYKTASEYDWDNFIVRKLDAYYKQ